MSKDFIIHYDKTVGMDEVALLQSKIMEARLMHPDCNFQLQEYDGSSSDPYGINSLYPEIAIRNGEYADQGTSHVVLSRNELVSGADDYRYRVGQSFVMKQNLGAWDGLSYDEKSDMLGLTLHDQLNRMYGLTPDRDDDYAMMELIASMEEEERLRMLMDDVDDEEEPDELPDGRVYTDEQDMFRLADLMPNQKAKEQKGRRQEPKKQSLSLAELLGSGAQQKAQSQPQSQLKPKKKKKRKKKSSGKPKSTVNLLELMKQ